MTPDYSLHFKRAIHDFGLFPFSSHHRDLTGRTCNSNTLNLASAHITVYSLFLGRDWSELSDYGALKNGAAQVLATRAASTHAAEYLLAWLAWLTWITKLRICTLSPRNLVLTPVTPVPLGPLVLRLVARAIAFM